MVEFCFGGSFIYVPDAGGRWVLKSKLEPVGDMAFKNGGKFYVPERDARGKFNDFEE